MLESEFMNIAHNNTLIYVYNDDKCKEDLNNMSIK